MTQPAGDRAGVRARRVRARLREASVNLPRPAWLRWPRAHADVADPSAAMFQRIRRSMTLLYAAVLVVTLLLAGTVLYVAVQQTVQHTIIDTAQGILNTDIHNLSGDWIRNESFTQASGGCPLGGPDSNRIMYACYDTRGNLLQTSPYAVYVAENVGVPFTENSLAQSARSASTGCAPDTQRGTSGDVMREACVVRDPSSGQVLGVVQVGQPIGNTLEQLHALLVLLLIVGGFTVLIAALGGFLLSARALVPARLAYTRQQRFIADVSHELRTPLTLLRADAEMLLRGRVKLTEDDAELLDDIVDETERLAALTSSLLTLARLDSSTRLPEREVIDLAEVAAEVARRVGAYASEREVTVRVEAAPGLLISGARDLVDQTALILVDNAIKYNHPGGTVDVRGERRGERVALIVRDTGVGVAPEHLAHLGERFFRPDKARVRQNGEAGGAGLGVSIARSVAAAHQGTLTFESAPGEGLTATLELPVARPRQPQTPTSATPNATPNAAPGPTPEPHAAQR